MKTTRLLGFAIESSSKNGVRIQRVIPGSPAGKYGMMKGDNIIQVNSQKIKNRKEFTKIISTTKSQSHQFVLKRKKHLLRLRIIQKIFRPKKDQLVSKTRHLDCVCRDDNSCNCTSPLFKDEACVREAFYVGPGSNGGTLVKLRCRDTAGFSKWCGPFEFF